MGKETEKFRRSITFYEKFSTKLHLPYQLFWSLLAIILLIIFYLLVINTSGKLNNFLMPTFASFIIAYVPIVITWASKKLSNFEPRLISILINPKDGISSWYQNQLKLINSSKRMFIGGIIFTLTFVPSTVIASKWWQFPRPWFDSLLCDMYLTILVALASFMLGTAVSVLIYTSILVFQVSKMDFKITIYQHPEMSIKAIGQLYMKFALVASIAVMILVLTFITSPLEMTPLIAFWLISMSLLVSIYFLAPLFRIHRKMRETKHDKLHQFSLTLEEMINEVIRNPSPETLQKIKDMMQIQKHLLEMSEWPFELPSILSLITTSVLPIIAVLLQLIEVFENV